MSTLIIDIETSGLPKRKGYGQGNYDPKLIKYYENARIIELAYNIIDDENNILHSFDSLIIPDGFDITNTQFHGITSEECNMSGKLMTDVFEIISNDINKYNVKIIVSHNIAFDVNILLSECYRYNNLLSKKIINCKKICTMLIGQKCMNLSKWPKLTHLYKYFYGNLPKQEHRAKSDMEYCMKCYIKIKMNYILKL
jgi:DNA polymerase III epsilon subunit-like protein